jgi:hypothetical protein
MSKTERIFGFNLTRAVAVMARLTISIGLLFVALARLVTVSSHG